MPPPPPPRPPAGGRGRRMTSRDGGERAAYFARREAASVLRRVLQGSANRRSDASIKSLVYSPSVRNKRATLALVCQTLKYLSLLKQIISSTKILSNRWKKQEELVYVAAYDILFGKEVGIQGPVEKFLARHKSDLKAALTRICIKRRAKSVQDLLACTQDFVKPKPRYVRVNTLKISREAAFKELEKICKVEEDAIVPDVLLLPPGTDLHDHPLVVHGEVFLQGKASSMVAAALCPKPGWNVIDACAAPGNKTIHLAALMKGKGNIIACEIHDDRAKILQDTVRKSGASNINIMHGDFLTLEPEHPAYAKVHAILLDPSCSGSGISTERLDYLLPAQSKDVSDDASNIWRIKKLSAFQTKALMHALKFPSVERVIYSTCSIHQEENEDVVNSVLPLATSLGFKLGTPFPQWPHRGLPVFDGCEHLLRTNPEDGLEGFFIALFVRETSHIDNHEELSRETICKQKRKVGAFPFFRLSKALLYPSARRKNHNKHWVVSRLQQKCSDR